jgi:NADPH-dependent 2,4-dienoyl-CoA reductase/sulfur reductase-like enzyme
VVDEGYRDGGQIYRRQPPGFTRSYSELYGTEADKAESLHACFERLKRNIVYKPGTLAWNIERGRLHVVTATEAQVLAYDSIIICSGATDRLFPVQGWQYAGCFSLGASQIALKSQACAIGSRVIFLGTGPLLYLVASQYVKAGARVQAVLDTSRFTERIRALPQLASRMGTLIHGLKLTTQLARAGVELLTGITPIEILGSNDAGVSAVRIRTSAGVKREIECDAIGLGYHLRAESQLADLAQCEFRFDEESSQWLPRVDEDGRSSVSGVYLAGDGARVLGADGAELAGRLAALAALDDSGVAVNTGEVRRLRSQLQQMDRFRRGLLTAFPWPSRLAVELQDSTVVCRCEGVTAGDLRHAVRGLGADEVNRAKALCRVGMGRCQGRYCGHAAAEIIAHTANVPVHRVGRLRGQGPVKPLPVAAVSPTLEIP